MPRGRSIASDERQVKTLALLRAGWRASEVAKELGYSSESGVRYAYSRAMQRALREPADELREMHHQRLLDLWRRSYQIATTDTNPDRALRAIDRCVAIQERDARLMGLDEPTKTQTTVVTESTVDAEIARLSAELERVSK